MEKQYYIYAHINHLGEIIYIGKGSDYSKGTRAYNWTGRPYPREEVDKIVILPMRYTNEMLAFEVEQIITEHYKNLGQCKYNKGTGTKHSENTKKIMMEKKIGYKHTDDWKIQHSEDISGEKNHWYGKHLSEEHKRKISEGHKNKSPQEKSEINNKRKKTWDNKTKEEIREWKMKISKANSGKKYTTPQKVRCLETGEVFNSIEEAIKWCNLKTTKSIKLVLKGKAKSAGGYHWEYIVEK